MTQVQAARTSVVELKALIQGKNREQQELWEIARWMRWHDLMGNPYVKPGGKPASPRAMLRFPWEEPEREITREDCHVSAKQQAILNSIFEDYDRRTKHGQTS